MNDSFELQPHIHVRIPEYTLNEVSLSGKKIAHMDRLIRLNSPTIADVNPDLQILHFLT